MRFYLINREKDSFSATVYVIFLNKGLFKERAKERTVVNKPKPVLTKSRSGSKSPSTSPSRRSPTRSKTMVTDTAKSVEAKATEKNFQAYLNRLVDTHAVQIRNLVDEHNSLNEYIHLNKTYNNLPPNFAEKSLENCNLLASNND